MCVPLLTCQCLMNAIIQIFVQVAYLIVVTQARVLCLMCTHSHILYVLTEYVAIATTWNSLKLDNTQ